MKRGALVLLFSVLYLLSFAQEPPVWQQRTDIDLKATLFPDQQQLEGNVKINYFNQSPDTLFFIWMHAWPNAYKNDKTYYTDQSILYRDTRFYFSDQDKRGYINRLNFRVNNRAAIQLDDSMHQDIIKVLLPEPLPPAGHCTIETSFFEKLPFNFSHFGYDSTGFSLVNWFPRPAVYDTAGWHAQPLNYVGATYHNPGDFKMTLTLPEKFSVVASGNQTNLFAESDAAVVGKSTQKTIRFECNQTDDFVFFVSNQIKQFKDSLHLPDGRLIDIFFYQKNKTFPFEKIRVVKQALLNAYHFSGKYPLSNFQVMEVASSSSNESSYPGIALYQQGSEDHLSKAVGLAYWKAIFSVNENASPWLLSGLNASIQKHPEQLNKIDSSKGILSAFIAKRMPADKALFNWQLAVSEKRDQPLETPLHLLSPENYYVNTQAKSKAWFSSLRNYMGEAPFITSINAFAEESQKQHASISLLQQVAQRYSDKPLQVVFDELYKTDNLFKPSRRKSKLVSFFSLRNTDQYKYISVLPLVGYNAYDGFKFGAALHNYSFPANKIQYIVAPMYAIGSKRFNGVARLEYNKYLKNPLHHIQVSLAANSFSYDDFTDSVNIKHYQGFSKLVPSFKWTIRSKNPLSSRIAFIQWKTFFIEEQLLQFYRDTILEKDVLVFPKAHRYLNQLVVAVENKRALYPYDANLKVEQAADFVRLAFTGNYFFNYKAGGGLDVRFFVGKFLYVGQKTIYKQFATDAYHLNMSGANGYEDYAYENYFAGRNEFAGWQSQQIMKRDGFFKVRSDLLSSKIGKTDNWLMALNFSSTLPKSVNPLSVLPIKIPMKVFADIGTYADAWQKDATTGRFIFDAGLQVSLFHNLVNIYMPILYSKVFGDYFKSTVSGNRFLKNISFSIDIQKLSTRDILKNSKH